MLSTLVRLFTAALLAFSFDVLAQQCEDPGSTMAWKIDDSAADVYLMGSIHVGNPDLYPLDAVIERLFRDADYLVFEVDPNVINSPAVALDIQQRGMLPAGETLSDHISPETMNRLRDTLATLGMPMQLVERMKPWLVINVLTSLQVMQMDLLPQLGTENYVLLSKSPDSEILELESMEVQVNYLSSMNSEIYLRETLDSFGAEGETLMKEMLAAWNCADHEDLTRIMSQEYSDPDMDEKTLAAMQALEETLLYSRNEIMTDRIVTYMNDPGASYFVIVGAAHLLGERSIIDLLHSRGHSVTPVRQP